MQNETQNEIQNKPKPTISFSNLPSIIVAVIFIVGIGAVFGLLGYLVSGIKENVTPVAQKPSVKITDDYFGNDFIQVKSPQKNATIKNPVLISGKANVDEANVRVKITDDNENILANTFITADGWMDKLYSFERKMSYEAPQTKNGLIEIFEESARDGSEIYKVEVPVVFDDYINVLDWQTYNTQLSNASLFKDLENPFTFKYPSNWSLVETKGGIEVYSFTSKMGYGIGTLPEDQFKVEIWYLNYPNNPNNLGIHEWCDEKLNNYNSSFRKRVFSRQERIINDLDVTEIEFELEESKDINGKFACFAGEKNDNITVLGHPLNSVHMKVFNQILSTFKFIEKEEVVFQKSGKFEFFGTLTLTGYLDIKRWICNEGDMCSETVDYASFVFEDTDNDLIYDFLSNNKGNSFVGNNSVGIGCYEKDKNIINSMNLGDSGRVKNTISGEDLNKLLNSNRDNPVKLKLTKPVPAPGMGAPECYSHFRLFEVL